MRTLPGMTIAATLALELMAATQRPVAEAAPAEPSAEAAWPRILAYAIDGSADRSSPPAIMKFMAEPAGPVKTVVVGASHAPAVSRPAEVAALVEEAASAC